MTTEFSLDLRKARRQAGFIQSDIAHLMAAHQSTVSDLELGNRVPTVDEIVALSLIYGRSFESLFGPVMSETRLQLLKRLKTLPEARDFAGTFNREASIRRLGERLTADTEDHAG